MLNKQAKQVLQTLRHHREINNLTDLYPHCRRYVRSEDDLLDALIFLQEREYLVCTLADDTVSDIALTYEGKHYGQFRWVECKKFLIQSVCVPILVSFVTAVITAILTILTK